MSILLIQISLLNRLPFFLPGLCNRAEVIFGLNALHGRTIGPGNNVIGPWNSSNAESLIRYTVSNNYTIYGWELGKTSYPTFVIHLTPALNQLQSPIANDKRKGTRKELR